MGAARRQFTDEFKREEVELLVSSGRPLSQIAGETLAAIPHAGADLAAESVWLRRENERLRIEREVLKKRCAFSREAPG